MPVSGEPAGFMCNVQYECPHSVDEALRLLSEGGTESKIIAGGTNLVVYLRERVVHPRLIVDVSRLPGWRNTVLQNSRTRLGPNRTITDLLNAPGRREGTQLLNAAAAWFAGPSIRNRATMAGNLADASPAADMAIPLLALDAEIEIASLRSGTRSVPIGAFLLGPGRSCLRPDELITSLIINNHAGAEVAYFKLGKRDSMAISIISAAVLVELHDQRCSAIRIALGAVAPVPFRAFRAEELLLNSRLDPKSVAEAAKIARDYAQPISDIRASAEHRSEMVEVVVSRLLTEIAVRCCSE